MGSLVAKYKVTVCSGNKSLDQSKDEWDGRHFVLSARYLLLKFPLATEYATSITIEIMISEVWDKDDPWVPVDESKWDEYGIIIND